MELHDADHVLAVVTSTAKSAASPSTARPTAR
jgi:hypothetical protein